MVWWWCWSATANCKPIVCAKFSEPLGSDFKWIGSKTRVKQRDNDRVVSHKSQPKNKHEVRHVGQERPLYYSQHKRSCTWYLFVCHRGSCHVRRTWRVIMQRDRGRGAWWHHIFGLSDLVEPQEQEEEMRLWKCSDYLMFPPPRPPTTWPSFLACSALSLSLSNPPAQPPTHHPLPLALIPLSMLRKSFVLLSAALNTLANK